MEKIHNSAFSYIGCTPTLPEHHVGSSVIHLAYTDIKHQNYISFRRLSEYSCNHVHGAAELLYLFSGRREFFINDRSIELIPGDLLIINSNVVHKASDTVKERCEGFLMYLQEQPGEKHEFEAGLPVLFDAPFRLFRLDTEHRSTVENHLSRLQYEMKEKQEGYELAVHSIVSIIFVLMARVLRSSAGENEVAHLSITHERISRIAEYINSHYHEQLSLQQISDTFFLSPAYFSRLFRRITGYTFVEYLNAVRVREAIRLLTDKELKVSWIADRVGFGSVTHFGRVFKEVTGHHPSHFRTVVAEF